jgi:hypothetical protein
VQLIIHFFRNISLFIRSATNMCICFSGGRIFFSRLEVSIDGKIIQNPTNDNHQWAYQGYASSFLTSRQNKTCVLNVSFFPVIQRTSTTDKIKKELYGRIINKASNTNEINFSPAVAEQQAVAGHPAFEADSFTAPTQAQRQAGVPDDFGDAVPQRNYVPGKPVWRTRTLEALCETMQHDSVVSKVYNTVDCGFDGVSIF